MFNAHGLDATWVEPSTEQAQKFFDDLSKRAIREETNLVRATTVEEVAYIATRMEEANLAAEAGSVGFTEWETSDAEVILEEDPTREDKAAGEQSGAAAESSSDEDAAEERPQEEPLAPKKAKRVLRKAASGVPANQTSSSSEAPGKKAAGKAAPRQGVRQQPVRRTRHTPAATTGVAGASHTTAPEVEAAESRQHPAPAAANQHRTPPPPPHTDTTTEDDFDNTGIRPEREEEE
jgi:hypothetical protein